MDTMNRRLNKTSYILHNLIKLHRSNTLNGQLQVPYQRSGQIFQNLKFWRRREASADDKREHIRDPKCRLSHNMKIIFSKVANTEKTFLTKKKKERPDIYGSENLSKSSQIETCNLTNRSISTSCRWISRSTSSSTEDTKIGDSPDDEATFRSSSESPSPVDTDPAACRKSTDEIWESSKYSSCSFNLLLFAWQLLFHCNSTLPSAAPP